MLRITPHGVTKVSPFEAHMGEKQNTPLFNLATTISPDNLNWEKTKHSCSDQKNLTKPAQPAEIMHVLEQWSGDEVSIKRRPPLPTSLQVSNKSRPQQASGAKN